VLAQLATDLRYAARIALRRKWVSLAVVLSIGLGIAGTTAIVAVIDRILLRELPVDAPNRVVWLRTTDSRRGRTTRGANPGDAFDWRARSTAFSAVGWYNEGETTIRLSENDDPARLRFALVSLDFARALGVRAALGQLFAPNDYAGGSNSVVVTHRFWRQRLASDPNAIGRTVFLNNVPRTIVGVLAPGGDLLPESDFELWRPLQDDVQQRTQSRTATYFVVVARLADGVPLQRAQEAMNVVSRQLALEYPATNATRSATLEPLKDGVVGPAQPMFLLLGGAVATLLTIACASVANLLVSQSEDRSREVAVRIALGGSPRRLVEQLVTESMMLCVVGGALGVLIAPATLAGFAALYPGALPRASELGIDWRVLIASTLAIVLAGLVASIPLVRQALRAEAARGLGVGGRLAGSRRQRRVANALVVAQMAMSIVLLFGGWLLLATYRTISQTSVGFDAEHLLTFDVSPSRARYPSARQVDAFYSSVEQRLRQLPGVRAVGVSNLIPFAPGNLTELYKREGYDDELPNQPGAKLQVASDDFVRAIGLPLLRGRMITEADGDSTPSVVVVNSALAATHFPGTDVLGKRVTMRGRTWEIVGVVGDKRHTTLRDAPMPEMFVSRRQLPRELGGWVVVRTTGDPASVMGAVRAAVREADPTIAVAHVATMADRRAESAAAERFRAIVVAVFAGVALMLAALGLYGVVADGVSRRTREIGIRTALGESSEQVQRGVLVGAVVLCLTGVVAGVVGSIFAAAGLQPFLLAQTSFDGAALAAVSGVLCVVTIIAAYLPARRASRVDPMVALRD
jgi:predicted permease